MFSFPDSVNEVSARLVAAGVAVLSLAMILLGCRGSRLIAYGFVARVLSGPTLSPLGQLVTRVIVPRLGVVGRPVLGAPRGVRVGLQRHRRRCRVLSLGTCSLAPYSGGARHVRRVATTPLWHRGGPERGPAVGRSESIPTSVD